MDYSILIVEDEVHIRQFLKAYFVAEGWHVYEASNGEDALATYKKVPHLDLVLLDIMMEKMTGIEVCSIIRQDSNIPILMITAIEDEYTQINCYEIGADDYITKPLKAKILIAKIKRLLSNRESTNSPKYCYNNFVVDDLARTVEIDGKPIALAPKEYSLLLYFIKNKNIALTRQQILNEIWGYETDSELRMVDNHILKIRQKLGPYASLIKTVITVGYKYEEN